jgi:hypothetical protein
MRTWTIILPFIPDGQNKRERKHWRRNDAEKKRVEHHLFWACQAASMPRLVDVKPGSKTYNVDPSRTVLRSVRRGIAIEVQKKPSNGQRDDPSNLDTRSKPILDVLVGMGQLVDDSAKWLDWTPCKESRHPDGPRVVITITEPEETAA